MKKTSISIDMETEKLRALRFYLEKKRNHFGNGAGGFPRQAL